MMLHLAKLHFSLMKVFYMPTRKVWPLGGHWTRDKRVGGPLKDPLNGRWPDEEGGVVQNGKLGKKEEKLWSAHLMSEEQVEWYIK